LSFSQEKVTQDGATLQGGRRLTLGTDPEFFILDPNGKPVPAWRFYPPKQEKKYYKHRWEYAGQGSYFRDGYALEINTRPEVCRALLSNDLRAGLLGAVGDLPEGFTLTTTPAIKIEKEDLLGAPMDCTVFGCDPALNAYTGEMTTPNIDPHSHLWRYAGGHMHFGGNVEEFPWLANEQQKMFFIKLCDLFIGLPLAYLFDDDANRQRRKYYGRAGECRMQEYPENEDGQPEGGVEYRVPSPQLWNDYPLAQMFFGVMRTIARHVVEFESTWRSSWETAIQEQINNCDVSISWLQEVADHYTPHLLADLKQLKKFADFRLLDQASIGNDTHSGMVEWVESRYKTQSEYNKVMGIYAHRQHDLWTDWRPYPLTMRQGWKQARG
jgi:hypothetical protein